MLSIVALALLIGVPVCIGIVIGIVAIFLSDKQ